MSVPVRPLRASDRERWDVLWRGYLTFYETELPAAQYDLHFSRLTDPSDRHWHALVAEDADGQPCGLAHVLVHPHGWQPVPITYLQDLYVDTAMRGQGAGRALIEAVYALADDLGARGTYWNTQTFNTTARTLYDRVGRLTPFIKYVRS